VFTRVDILNDITSKILGGGTCPPCPIGIDAPAITFYDVYDISAFQLAYSMALINNILTCN